MAGYVESTPICPIGEGTPVSPCLVVVATDIYVTGAAAGMVFGIFIPSSLSTGQLLFGINDLWTLL